MDAILEPQESSQRMPSGLLLDALQSFTLRLPIFPQLGLGFMDSQLANILRHPNGSHEWFYLYWVLLWAVKVHPADTFRPYPVYTGFPVCPTAFLGPHGILRRGFGPGSLDSRPAKTFKHHFSQPARCQ